MRLPRTEGMLRSTTQRRPPPFVVDPQPAFDPFDMPVAGRLAREESAVTSVHLVHVASVGLLGVLGVVAAPWWAFGLLCAAWMLAVWAS